MVEKLTQSDSFDFYQESNKETEKQFFPKDPELFNRYKASAELQAIEQLYLSQLDEPYSLRLRESVSSQGTLYTAALKDRGELTDAGLRRLEVETPISDETYHYYKSMAAHPTLHKLRIELQPGITVDWCEGLALPIVEIENLANNHTAQQFYEDHKEFLIDRTGSPEISSEALAHQLCPHSMPPTPEAISSQEILAHVMRLKRKGINPIIVGISGRSGSGKTTLTKELVALAEQYFSVAQVSTDDYHRGRQWLENTYGVPWTNWDAPIVYDTNLLNYNLWQLSQGKSIDARRFDFIQEEPITEGKLNPTELMIVEGIYAGSPDLASQRHLHIQVPTPLATSIGRRLARDYSEGRFNTSLGDPKTILRYQLEIAEPMYQQQLAA
ncbi:MAG TPA: hypothetical protein VFT59_02625 [Candidatus Saccharimonadales bacterium]|nr:hypothetical protein [Candidatus Saccharimonadales bacterium]